MDVEIVISDMEEIEMFNDVNKIKDFIGEEKIKVIAKISTAEQLMGVLLTGVLAVYTPCAKEILTSFEEKFEVKIINE